MKNENLDAPDKARSQIIANTNTLNKSANNAASPPYQQVQKTPVQDQSNNTFQKIQAQGSYAQQVEGQDDIGNSPEHPSGQQEDIAYNKIANNPQIIDKSKATQNYQNDQQ